MKSHKLQIICFLTVALFHLSLFVTLSTIKKLTKVKIHTKSSNVSISFKKFTKSKSVQGKLFKGLRYYYNEPVNKKLVFDKIGNFGDKTGKVFGRDSTLYDYLYDYIKQRMYYPRYFMHMEVEGSVKVRLAFDQKGILQKNKIKISGSNRYMVVYLKELFLEMFRKPVPHKILDNEHPFTLVDISVRFVFEIKDNNSTLAYRRGRELGYVVNNHHVMMKGLMISPGEVIERFKENYTEKGIVRKKYWMDRMKEKI